MLSSLLDPDSLRHELERHMHVLAEAMVAIGKRTEAETRVRDTMKEPCIL